MITGLLLKSCTGHSHIQLNIKSTHPRRHRKMETQTTLKSKTDTETGVKICKNIPLILKLMEPN